MSNITLGSIDKGKIRLITANLTTEQWNKTTKIPLKGELCIANDTLLAKMGDGINPFSKLKYMWLSKEEIQNMITTSAFDLHPATSTLLGGVKIGANVNVDPEGKISVNDATLAQKGVVKLSSATNSVSETEAATSKAVKEAYDLAAGKADAVHNHDDMYYTESEIDEFLAGKSNTDHNHDDRYYTETEINEKVSDLQSKIDGKQNTITGGASTITGTDLAASKALVSNGDGKVAVSDVSADELAHLKGVTSSVQTQLDGKALKTHDHTVSQITDFPESMPASDVSEWAKQPQKPVYTATEVGAIPSTEKGAKNGVATLDETGIIPSSQLPSYVDDVLEFDTETDFPKTGETGKIYVAKDTNKTFRWSGTQYTEIAKSIVLGTTASTAFRGDYGQIAYEHSQVAHVTGIKGQEEDTYRTGQVNITLDNIGAAAKSHTHNYAGSETPGGAANTALKMETDKKISLTGAATAAAVSFNDNNDIALNVTALNAISLFLNPEDTLVLDGSSYFAVNA